MESFLEKVAAHVVKNYQGRTEKICLVFPNRRASLFFRRYLTTMISGPVWMPQCFSIEDFIFHVADFQKADTETLLFEFYHVHLQLNKEKAQALADFLEWADRALRDFNDLDLYLIDAKQIFTYLDEAKALAVWSPEGKELTAFEKDYLRFFQNLLHYYEGLSSALIKRKKLSQGQAYRYVADNIQSLSGELEWEKVIFAGFNALNHAEEKILEHLTFAGRAEIFWDIDKYYLDDRQQEAGRFLREMVKKQSATPVNWIVDHLSSGEKRVYILGAPKQVLQARVAGQILSELPPEALGNTALVLGDEGMLLPVLHSMPANIGDFNVTMGYPLKLASLDALFESVFQLFKSALRYTSALSKKPESGEFSLTFYHSDLLRFFRHPSVQRLWELKSGEKADATPEKKILLLNRSFYRLRDLEHLLFEGQIEFWTFVRSIFSIDPNDFLSLHHAFEYLTDEIRMSLEPGKGIAGRMNLDIEFLYAFSRLFKRIGNHSKTYQIFPELEGFRQLYRQSVRSTHLPFYGEPLKGVQVMGLLETRTLDFENLILLNLNEDILPSGRNTNSFIPFDIRREFGLPTFRESQAVYAYHFYRLLQRASNIYLVYNTEAGQVGGGDPSRFLRQITEEWPKKNPRLSITESVVNLPPTGDERAAPIVVEKGPELLEQIGQCLSGGLSATSLNAYRKCRLQFYFRAIRKLAEAREVEESIEADTFGSVIHKALEKLYSPHKNKILEPADYQMMNESLPDMLRDAFSEVAPVADLSGGKNLLLAFSAQELVRKHLRLEKQRLEGDPLHGSTIPTFLEHFCQHQTSRAKYIGYIDRVDLCGTSWLIIDYKTGKLEKADLKIGDFGELHTNPEKDKLFQLLFYAYLFNESENRKGFPIEAGMLSFRKLNDGVIFPDIKGKPDDLRPYLIDFMGLLDKMVDEILDPAVAFSQTEDASLCVYCAYRSICMR